MVVYNKVIPNQAHNTLVSLALGVGVLLIFDLLFKVQKAKITNDACKSIENNLGPRLYQKILMWDLQMHQKQ